MIPFRCLLLLFLLPALTWAQATPPLERLISVDVRNERLSTVLMAISRTGQFSFSYNPAILNESRPVTLRLVNRPVRDVLGQLFGGSVRIKSRGNHVILLKADDSQKPRDFILDGYIINGQTGDRINEATVFERGSLRSSVSNNFGYYRLKLPTTLATLRLDVRRQAFVAQSLAISSQRSQPLNVYLMPQPVAVAPIDTRPLPVDTLPATANRPVIFASADSNASSSPSLLERSRQTLGRWALSAKQLIIDVNLNRDTLYRTWQVSLVPGISTNHALSSRIINDYSVNVLIGYSLGVRKAELGGLLNLVRADVQGLQAAGFGNLVGGQTRGVQLAGFFNTNRGDVGPVQAAGFINTVGGNMNGLQLAGYLNIVRGTATGLQAAGFLNANRHTTRGVQLAGFANLVGGDMLGWQVAGTMNVARGQLSGWQLSGLLNVARDVVGGGRQIGFINVAKSSTTTPFGFLSYVQDNGYRNLELSANEVTSVNATFRTGVRGFYNVFTAGWNPEKRIWSYGYGLGTSTSERRGWSLALEGTAQQLNQTAGDGQNLNLLLRLSPQLTKQFRWGMGLSAGATLNGYYSDNLVLNPLRNQSLPAVVVTPEGPDNDRNEWSGWLGWQVGLRYNLQKNP